MLHVWCLHGFLGTGRDWDPLVSSFPPSSTVAFHGPDLLSSPGEIRSFPYWSKRFNFQAGKNRGINILIGYSLGGRLALHALLEPSHPWAGAVIVSAHPGLPSPYERKERLARDEEWARRFEEASWEEILQDWNAQPAFGGKPPALPRPEENFSRPALAKALRTWSLGRQEPLWDRLHRVRVPLLWITGGEDKTYTRLGEEALRRLPSARGLVVPGAGHRVPWEAPEEFSGAVKDFLVPFLEAPSPHST